MKLLFQVRCLSDNSDFIKESKPHEDCFKMTVHNGFANKDVDAWGIRINTLEELIKFQNDVNCKLVIQKSPLGDKKNPLCLTVYDVWMDYQDEDA